MRPQALMDFIFPDEKGQHKQSLIDEDSMVQIRTIARNANRKKGGSQGSMTLAAGSAAQLVNCQFSLLIVIVSDPDTSSSDVSQYGATRKLVSVSFKSLLTTASR